MSGLSRLRPFKWAKFEVFEPFWFELTAAANKLVNCCCCWLKRSVAWLFGDVLLLVWVLLLTFDWSKIKIEIKHIIKKRFVLVKDKIKPCIRLGVNDAFKATLNLSLLRSHMVIVTSFRNTLYFLWPRKIYCILIFVTFFVNITRKQSFQWSRSLHIVINGACISADSYWQMT